MSYRTIYRYELYAGRATQFGTLAPWTDDTVRDSRYLKLNDQQARYLSRKTSEWDWQNIDYAKVPPDISALVGEFASRADWYLHTLPAEQLTRVLAATQNYKGTRYKVGMLLVTVFVLVLIIALVLQSKWF